MAKVGKKKSFQYGDAEEAAKKAASGFVGKSIKLPEGVSFFPMKDEKMYRLRFAPYLVGEHNPEQAPGTLWYTRKYWAHARIGAGEDGRGETYICARLSANKPCAVCDHIAKLRLVPTTSQELLDDLKPKQRQLFLVRDHDDKGKGWRILDLSYHALGKQLEAKIKGSAMASAGMDDDLAPGYSAKKFFYLEGGAVVSILMEDPKLKYKFLQAKSIEVTQTKEVLPETLLDELPCLDDCLVIPKYKDLMKILLQGDAIPGDDDDEEHEEATPADDDDDTEEAEETADEDDEEEVSGGGGKIRKTLPKFKVGDKVRFSDGRGKVHTGEITKINAKAGLASIDFGGKNPATIELDELEPVKAGKAAPEPAAKKKVKPTPVEEDDDDLDVEAEDEEVEDDDDLPDPDDEEEAEVEDDDDLPDPDDEEEEEPEPPKKGKKPVVKPAAKSKSRAFHEEPEEDDDFDMPDDDEDDEPAPPKKVKKVLKKK